MDLYIQVGVLLLFLAALALFIYIYTAPAQQFTAKINDTNQKINDRLVTVEGMDVAPFMNNVSTPGTTIYPIIRDAKAGKIAILVQTKNSQGLIVNYGYQMRAANDASVKMLPHGVSGVGYTGAPTATSGTDFEKNFVTSVQNMFGGGATSNTPIAYTKSTGVSLTELTGNATGNYDAATGYPKGSISGNPSTARSPKVAFSDPTIEFKSASVNGRTFAATGLMYTDQVLKMDMPVNDNYSYADNPGSLYRFDKNSAYYTTLVVNANNEVVGIYVEEHGVQEKYAALGQMMKLNGTITNLY